MNFHIGVSMVKRWWLLHASNTHLGLLNKSNVQTCFSMLLKADGFRELYPGSMQIYYAFTIFISPMF